jgi:hypothetical protein
VGVQLVGESLGLDLADPHLLEPVRVTREGGVHGEPVFAGEAGGLSRDHGGGPLGDPAGPERGPGVRQFGAQDFREPEVALPAVR